MERLERKEEPGVIYPIEVNPIIHQQDLSYQQEE